MSSRQRRSVVTQTLNEIADRFDADCRRHADLPDIAEYLPDDPTDRAAVLHELIRIHMEYRCRGGDLVRIDDYLLKFPELKFTASSLRGLIVEEFWVRQCFGDSPNIAEYLNRFPQLGYPLADALAEQLCQLLRERRLTYGSESGKPNRTPVGTELRIPQHSPVDFGDKFAIPGYELLEEIGEGGTAKVLRARQILLDRIVAVKLMPLDVASREQQSRIQREAMSAARLRHPAIVQIYDVGETDQFAYFSMEYAARGSLDRVVSRNVFPPRIAARILYILANAIDHAHQQGIVHRDIKPGNILLFDQLNVERENAGHRDSSSPSALDIPCDGSLFVESGSWPYTVKLADFGMAGQFSVAAGPKITATIVGTPGYMSPEQAMGESAQPASDIFSLGVVLYELITRRSPFPGNSPLNIMQQIRQADPVSPGSLVSVPRDLELICLKCLRKQPSSRYASGADLAEDLKLFLEHKPIKARQMLLRERLMQWWKRYPVTVASVTFAALLLLIVAGGGWLMQWQTNRAYQREVRERERADTALASAFDAIQRLVDVTNSVPLRETPAIEKVREQQSRESILYYTKLLSQYHDPPPHQYRILAAAHQRLGLIKLELGKLREASQALKRSEELWQMIIQGDSTLPDDELQFAIVQLNLGQIARANQNLDQAAMLAASALQTITSIQDRLPQARRNAILALELSSGVEADRGNASSSEKHLRSASVLARTLRQQDPDSVLYAEADARVQHNLALHFYNTGSVSAAQEGYDHAIESWRSLLRKFPASTSFRSSLAGSLEARGMLYGDSGDSESALTLLNESLDLRRQVSDDFAEVPEHQRALARSHSNLGAVNLGLREFAVAGEHFSKAIEIRETIQKKVEMTPGDRCRTAECRSNLGLALSAMRRHQEALQQYLIGDQEFDSLLDEYPDNVPFLVSACSLRQNLGAFLLSGDDPERGVDYLLRVIEKLTPVSASISENVSARSTCLNAHGTLAQFYAATGDFVQSASHWNGVIELSEGERIQNSYRLQRCLVVARYDAEDAVREAVKLEHQKSSLVPEDWYNLMCVYSLAAARLCCDIEDISELNRTECGEILERALRIFESESIEQYVASEQLLEFTIQDPDLKAIQQHPRVQNRIEALRQRLVRSAPEK